MNARLIFKMELFKYLRDKFYLIAALVLLILNILTTVLFVNFEHLSSGLLGTAILLGIILLFSNMIFLGIIYPFHLLAIDYKNRVLALMVASGVNRSKLFFSKIGATILATVVMSIILTIVPIGTIFFEVGANGGWDELFQNIGVIMAPEMVPLSIYSVLGYIAGLVMLMTAVILLKGKTLSILLYFGFSFIVSMVVAGPLMSSSTFDSGATASSWINVGIEAVVILVFGFIALQSLRHQNL